MRKGRVVPLAMEVRALKPNGLHLDSAHFATNRILPSIEGHRDAQPRGRAGTANEADDHLAAQQGLSTPVRRDVAKHAMLDLVPFARARRQMAYRHTQPCLIGEPLPSAFHRRARARLLPPPAAVMSRALAVDTGPNPSGATGSERRYGERGGVMVPPTLTHPRLAPTS